MSRPKIKIALFQNLRSGGARRTVIEFGKRLAKNYLVDVYSLDPKTKKDFTFANKVKIFQFLISNDFLVAQKQIIFDLPKIHKKIADKINEGNYTVAYVDHDIFTKAPYVLRYLKIPSVYFCHEPPREFYESFSLFSSTAKLKIINLLRYYLKFIDKKNARYANVIISSSEYSRKRNSKVYKRRVLRTRSGVDTRIFKFLYRKRENFYLTVGALAIFKGYDLLIKSIALLPGKYSFPLVAIVPRKAGRDKKKIEELAREHKVDLKIIEVKSEKELVQYYNRARLCLFAPYFEPFGLIPIEAMACGLPVVGVMEGGLIETILPGLGWLARRDPKAYAKAIIEALNQKLSFKKSLKLRNYVEKTWNWDIGAKQLENILIDTAKIKSRHR